MITWSKSTKPCPIITWDGVVFNGEHHYVDHIYYMIHVRPLGLSVPRPYLHMLGSSSLTWVFRVCKTGLHPSYVNVELITPDHHVVSRHDELSQRCILRENTYTLKFSERTSYNATAKLSKIRWSLTKFQGISVLPKYALLLQIVVPRHHVMKQRTFATVHS